MKIIKKEIYSKIFKRKHLKCLFALTRSVEAHKLFGKTSFVSLTGKVLFTSKDKRLKNLQTVVKYIYKHWRNSIYDNCRRKKL